MRIGSRTKRGPISSTSVSPVTAVPIRYTRSQMWSSTHEKLSVCLTRSTPLLLPPPAPLPPDDLVGAERGTERADEECLEHAAIGAQVEPGVKRKQVAHSCAPPCVQVELIHRVDVVDAKHG